MPADAGAGPPDTRALGLYNYGHFTSMVVADGVVKGLELHWERLRRDCEIVFGVALDVTCGRRAARHAVEETDGRRSVVVRLTVFDPQQDLAQPESATAPEMLATSRPAPDGPARPLRLRTVSYERDLPQVKHVGLFGAVTHRRAARRLGFDDALFVDRSGRVSEGPTWNLLCFDGERIVWPEAAMLPGITAGLLADVLDAEGVTQVTTPISVPDLLSMKAVYALNSVVGVRVIHRINDTVISGPGDVTDHLRQAYAGVPGESL
jgi:branched-subunit amino acid aminotransferase/4-amino-4-deoxychorismate lyase